MCLGMYFTQSGSKILRARPPAILIYVPLLRGSLDSDDVYLEVDTKIKVGVTDCRFPR